MNGYGRFRALEAFGLASHRILTGKHVWEDKPSLAIALGHHSLPGGIVHQSKFRTRDHSTALIFNGTAHVRARLGAYDDARKKAKKEDQTSSFHISLTPPKPPASSNRRSKFIF